MLSGAQTWLHVGLTSVIAEVLSPGHEPRDSDIISLGSAQAPLSDTLGISALLASSLSDTVIYTRKQDNFTVVLKLWGRGGDTCIYLVRDHLGQEVPNRTSVPMTSVNPTALHCSL